MRIAVVLLLLTGLAVAGQVPPGFQDALVAGGLNLPTACAFAPDGRLFILLKQGAVRIYKDGRLLSTAALNLSVSDQSERGLLGIAFDPNFTANRFAYLYYTTAGSNPKNRVSRFTVNGDTIDPGSEIVLLDGIRSDAGNHNAGWIQFGPDGKLYIATGDGGANADLAQGLNNINGKILRINRDGTIPADNPFAGQAGARGEIWCFGLRNPWRFAFDSSNGALFIGDVGQNRFEEVNIGVRGGNYGWPNAEGTSTNPGFINPIFTYDHNGGSASITGGIVYRGTAFPAEYRGAYFFADYVLGFIRYLKLTSANTVASVNDFSPDAGSVVHMTVGPDGALYYVLIREGQVRRIRFGTDNNSVPIAKATSTRRYGLLPLQVRFNANASFDPDGDSLQIRWDFGDGASASGREVSHTYTANANFTASLTVTDSRGASAAKRFRIFAGDRAPVPVITMPIAGTIVGPGQTIRFAGRASDPEDGALDASRLTWTVIQHHNDHTHPFLGPLHGVRNGSFTVPANDHLDGTVFYRIRLKAVDSRGLSIFAILDVPRR